MYFLIIIHFLSTEMVFFQCLSLKFFRLPTDEQQLSQFASVKPLVPCEVSGAALPEGTSTWAVHTVWI